MVHVGGRKEGGGGVYSFLSEAKAWTMGKEERTEGGWKEQRRGMEGTLEGCLWEALADQANSSLPRGLFSFAEIFGVQWAYIGEVRELVDHMGASFSQG